MRLPYGAFARRVVSSRRPHDDLVTRRPRGKLRNLTSSAGFRIFNYERLTPPHWSPLLQTKPRRWPPFSVQQTSGLLGRRLTPPHAQLPDTRPPKAATHNRHGNNPSRIRPDGLAANSIPTAALASSFTTKLPRNHHPAQKGTVCGADRPNISEPNNSLKVLRAITNGRWRCDMCFNHASTEASCSSKFLNTHRRNRRDCPPRSIHCQHRPATTKSQRDRWRAQAPDGLARGYKHWTSAVQLQNLIVAPYLARSWYVGASIIATRRKYRLVFRHMITPRKHVVIREEKNLRQSMLSHECA